MKIIYIIALVMLCVIVFVRCASHKENSITITKNQSVEQIHKQVIYMLTNSEIEQLGKIDITENTSSKVIAKCRTSNIPISNLEISNLSFSSYPSKSVANFELVFDIKNNACKVTLEDVKYDVYYDSSTNRNIPMAGPPKAEVSLDKKRLKEKTPELTKYLLDSINRYMSESE